MNEPVKNSGDGHRGRTLGGNRLTAREDNVREVAAERAADGLVRRQMEARRRRRQTDRAVRRQLRMEHRIFARREPHEPGHDALLERPVGH